MRWGIRRVSGEAGKKNLFLNLIVVIRMFALQQFFALSFEIRMCQSSNFFFSKMVLAIWDPLHFHINFRISLSVSAKKPVRFL